MNPKRERPSVLIPESVKGSSSFNLFDIFQGAETEMDFFDRLQETRQLLNTFDSSSDEANGVARAILASFPYTIDIARQASQNIESRAKYLSWELRHTLFSSKGSEIMLGYLSSQDIQEDESKFVLRNIIHTIGLPNLLNLCRELLTEYKKEGQDKKYQRLENILRNLLLLDSSKEVFRELGDLYDVIDFDKYPVTDKTIESRVNWLNSYLQENGVGREKSWKIVDVGCGTGDTVARLAESGYENIEGIDPVEKHIQTAQEKLQDGTEERFKVGDWKNLPYDDESLDVVMCMGRSLTHTEDWGELYRVFREFRRVLKKDGLLIIDMPDPNSPGYKEYMEYYAKLAVKLDLGASNPEYQWYIVDSPDEEHFYNRYTPEFEVIKKMLNMVGFSNAEIERVTVIPNEKGSQNWDITAVAVEIPANLQMIDSLKRGEQFVKKENIK